MKAELLFNFRVLDDIYKISAQTKIQDAYIKKSYRGFLAERIQKNIFYKSLFFLENFRIFIFTILKLTKTGSNNEVVYLASTKNQIRQISQLQKIFLKEDYVMYDLQNDKFYNLKSLGHIFPILASFSALIVYFRKSSSDLNPARLSNRLITVCYHAFFTSIFTKRRPKAVIVANDHSRIPLGFTGAARSLGIKTVYTQHAHISESLPKLRFDIALLYGQCAADVYDRKGDHKCEIVFRGQEGKENKMNLDFLKSKSSYTVGLFLNVFNEDALLKTLTTLETNEKVEKVLIRAHPAYPINKDFSAFEKVTISDSKNSLEQDCEKCDFIVGGNSSFHLSALKYGVPTLYYNPIDFVDRDYYGFSKCKICYEVESMKDINFLDVISFYSDIGWRKKFSYFDAGYLLDEHTLDEDIYEKIKILIDNQAQHYP